jgi:hypothetical protein
MSEDGNGKCHENIPMWVACSTFILKLSRFKFFLCCYIKQLDPILGDIKLTHRWLSELIG